MSKATNVVLAVAIAMSFSAQAEVTGSFGLVHEKQLQGARKAQDGATGTVAKDFKYADGDVTMTNFQSSNTSRVEAGATTKAFKLGDYAFTARGALGELYQSPKSNSFYSLETGVSTKVHHAFVVGTGFKYRDAFDRVPTQQLERTGMLNAAYIINKDSQIGVGYERSYGEVKSYTTSLVYKTAL